MSVLRNLRWCTYLLLSLGFLILASELPAAEPNDSQPSPNVSGATYECQIDPGPESNFTLALFKLWILDPAKPVDGILAVLPGSDCHGTPLADDPAWRKVAAGWNYALLGVTLTTNSSLHPYYRADLGTGAAFLEALERLSSSTRRPEIASAPIAILGHSQGGQFAFHLACWKPERVQAFAAIKGGYYEASLAAPARPVPGLMIAGEHDLDYRPRNLRALFDANAVSGTRWCFAQEPGVGHEPSRSGDLIFPFFDAVIHGAPKPWSADLASLQLTPLAETRPAGSAWLPDETSAQVWSRFVTGKLPPETLSLDLPPDHPPTLAHIAPASMDFGTIEEGATVKSITARVFPDKDNPEGAVWDEVQAHSVRGRFDVSVAQSPATVTVTPKTSNLPIGRLHDTIALRFSRGGIPILGGAEISVSFRHSDHRVRVDPTSLYVGSHSDERRLKFSITSTADTPLQIERFYRSAGTFAEISLESQTANTATFECVLQALPEDGSHSGVFTIELGPPINRPVLVPFIAAYKSPSTTAPEPPNRAQPVDMDLDTLSRAGLCGGTKLSPNGAISYSPGFAKLPWVIAERQSLPCRGSIP